MFHAEFLTHLSADDLYETALIHGFGVCSAGSTCETDVYRVRIHDVALDYAEMCRCVCELYRRNLLPRKSYDLRQVLDLTPKCQHCKKDVTRDGSCGYDDGFYARADVCCARCAPLYYQPFTNQTYDAALAWTFYQMIESSNIMLDEIKQEMDLLRLVKRRLDS